MTTQVSSDKAGYSLSFNEFLQLVSLHRRREPDTQTLLQVFMCFDPSNTGEICEEKFRKIMKSKEGVYEEEVNEMIAEYRSTQVTNIKSGTKSAILYKDFIAMLMG